MIKDIEPFLTMPFSDQPYEITEGWRYSAEEKAIHGFSGHAGIDFALPRGTPVLASADGLPTASYFGYPLIRERVPVLYQGKQIHFGLGLFVQIYHRQQNLYTSYGHLEEIADNVRFHQPIKKGERFWPIGHKIDPGKLESYKFATEIKRGQIIGYVGDSGLGWGYEDFPERPDPEAYPSFDEVHLHFEVFRRVGSRKKKEYFDPYGIQSLAEDYPDSFKTGKNLGGKSPVLWILDEDMLPKFI